MDGKFVEESDIKEDIHLGELARGVFSYYRPIFSLKNKKIIIELTFYDSNMFFKRFDLRELALPRRSGFLQ